jgi:hypothetical protein
MVGYVAEQPIRVSRAADLPEITRLRLAACPISPAWLRQSLP